jgi:hypothetical protein
MVHDSAQLPLVKFFPKQRKMAGATVHVIVPNCGGGGHLPRDSTFRRAEVFPHFAASKSFAACMCWKE